MIPLPHLNQYLELLSCCLIPTVMVAYLGEKLSTVPMLLVSTRPCLVWMSLTMFCCPLRLLTSLLSPPVREDRKGRKMFQITVAESFKHSVELLPRASSTLFTLVFRTCPPPLHGQEAGAVGDDVHGGHGHQHDLRYYRVLQQPDPP